MSKNVVCPSMLSIKKAAAQVGISEYFLRNLCRDGKIRFVCSGTRWLVNMDSLAAYLNKGDDPKEVSKPAKKPLRKKNTSAKKSKED